MLNNHCRHVYPSKICHKDFLLHGEGWLVSEEAVQYTEEHNKENLEDWKRNRENWESGWDWLQDIQNRRLGYNAAKTAPNVASGYCGNSHLLRLFLA